MARTDDEYEHAEIEIHGGQGRTNPVTTIPHNVPIPKTTRQASENATGNKAKNTNPFQTHSKISIIPEKRKEELNMGYLATLPGVLKLAEIVILYDYFCLFIN